VADEHRAEGLAGVEDRGGETVSVGACEAGVDQQGLALAGDQDCRLVLGAGGEVEVEDLEGQRHGESFLGAPGEGPGDAAWWPHAVVAKAD
jgi:hypothetical protein